MPRAIAASAEDVETAALASGMFRLSGETGLPMPLQDADAARYQRIFSLEDQERWSDADREIAALHSKLLLGHVLALRYLSDHGYRAKFAELSSWLQHYSGLPEAPQIYRIAVNRMPKGSKHPRRPEVTVYNASASADDGSDGDLITSRSAALEWESGLAAWRLGQFEGAAEHFTRLARADAVDSWTRAAGAYWAARSYMRAGVFDQVEPWFEVGAQYPYTFYGILARKIAGKPFAYNWQMPTFTPEDAGRVATVPAGVRALGLIQIGDLVRAESELRRINPATPEMARALLAISQRVDMPTLAMQLAEQTTDARGRHYDAALYPAPSWALRDGFNLDRALVLAVVRQESKFLTRAKSSAGARGLMQLMPGTARFAATGTGFGSKRHDLFEPEINLTLGQNYLAHLMSIYGIGDNLLMVVAAYNGGPGNLARWQNEMQLDDPLLFIESIPNAETRRFVKHVIANYWIYRDQLGQPSPALDAMAAGDWPTYRGLDNAPVPAAAGPGGSTSGGPQRSRP